ncbi:hypothetical protein HYC85_009786 [Camellia sinensis]|uniref:Uncharacterized protein n=1 Tax=Camellia sinensis TaxID=4442 RepID=A0A7J7HG06_CAMSI|nr:hypothetical protein HYC85_009786 [Camellia sinensis]
MLKRWFYVLVPWKAGLNLLGRFMKGPRHIVREIKSEIQSLLWTCAVIITQSKQHSQMFLVAYRTLIVLYIPYLVTDESSKIIWILYHGNLGYFADHTASLLDNNID